MGQAVRLHQIVTGAFHDERNPDLGIDLAQRQRNRAEAIDVSQTDAVRRLEQHDWSLTQRCLLALLVHVSPIGIIGEEQLIILQTASDLMCPRPTRFGGWNSTTGLLPNDASSHCWFMLAPSA